MLDQLCPALCDAVTGANTSQSMLEALERANFFLQPLDAERNWYRLHPLLLETLRRELRASMAQSEPVLHVRAARWFLEQRMIDEAFRHAVAGGDRELAAQIAESYVVTKLESGEYRTIQEWLEIVPAEWYAECPELNILPMALSIFSGDIEGGLRIIRRARCAAGRRRGPRRGATQGEAGRCPLRHRLFQG